MTNQELGLIGENLGAIFLKKKGHRIIQRNFTWNRGEIDIITTFEDKIHITEVKTRQTAEIGEPWRAVTRTKQKQIIKVADQYLKAKNLNKDAVFNIISIVHNQYKTDLEFIPDAFTP
ncbi:MAG: putative endonuclease [Lentimonas sp.]|jgi:putative endonuclease